MALLRSAIHFPFLASHEDLGTYLKSAQTHFEDMACLPPAGRAICVHPCRRSPSAERTSCSQRSIAQLTTR